jgi:ferrous iron transport protein B
MDRSVTTGRLVVVESAATPGGTIGATRKTRTNNMPTRGVRSDSRAFTVALAGNPNCGKTTLFNGLTGSRQRIGNWPGVTVERKEGLFTYAAAERLLVEPFQPTTQHTTTASSAELRGAEDRQIRVVDLPGIYSLSASSEDEAIARDFLVEGNLDLVVNVVDASNIQRNLYLTLQLVEMRVPVLVVLNMSDVAAKRGIRVDADHLSEHLGCPVIGVAAIRPDDITRTKEAVVGFAGAAEPSTVRIPYPEPIERALKEMQTASQHVATKIGVDPRWIGLKLLEEDPWVIAQVVGSTSLTAEDLAERIAGVRSEMGDDVDVALADARYGFIHGLTRHVSRERLNRRTFTEIVDSVVMNRVLALPIFFLVMLGVFWATMSIGGAFIDFFDLFFGAIFVDGLGALLTAIHAPPGLIGVLAGGIGTGIQTVATFIPIIFTMFVVLSLLEDSGYMSRAAYVMDRFMHAIGLPGKSFLPMMVGFGCTVPAILGTRTLESRRDRCMTIFMVPNMSCGARLPVYALFAAAFFPERSGLVVFSLYAAGIVMAIGTGFFLKLTLFRGKPSHFVMELPQYHAPRLRFVAGQAWHRLVIFVKRAGVTITLIVTVLSLLNSGAFGRSTESAADAPDDVAAESAAEDQTLLSAVARAITPIFGPMGVDQDNWPATVALFTGLFAKEAVVGTINALYGQAAAEQEDSSPSVGRQLVAAFRSIPVNLLEVVRPSSRRSPVDPDNADPGEPAAGEPSPTDEDTTAPEEGNGGAGSALFVRLRQQFSPAGAYAYLLFVLIYIPCAAALATAIREMGHLLGWLLALYSTVLAWSVGTLFYQLATGPSAYYLVLPLVVMSLLGFAFRAIGVYVMPTHLAKAPGRVSPCDGCKHHGPDRKHSAG